MLRMGCFSVPVPVMPTISLDIDDPENKTKFETHYEIKNCSTEGPSRLIVGMHDLCFLSYCGHGISEGFTTWYLSYENIIAGNTPNYFSPKTVIPPNPNLSYYQWGFSEGSKGETEIHRMNRNMGQKFRSSEFKRPIILVAGVSDDSVKAMARSDTDNGVFDILDIQVGPETTSINVETSGTISFGSSYDIMSSSMYRTGVFNYDLNMFSIIVSKTSSSGLTYGVLEVNFNNKSFKYFPVNGLKGVDYLVDM